MHRLELRFPASRLRSLLLHFELSGDAGTLTPDEEEFTMTGEEMLRDVEQRAEQRGEQRGEERGGILGRQEGAQRMVRHAFERRFGPMPESMVSAMSKASKLEELERIMDACLTGSRGEVEQMLRPPIH